MLVRVPGHSHLEIYTVIRLVQYVVLLSKVLNSLVLQQLQYC